MYSSDQLQMVIDQVHGAALLGIGDNVLDCYLHEDLAYPGGNALNVAVYTKLLLRGTASFIGVVGQDKFGDHLLGVLDQVGVTRHLCRRAQGPTGMAFVELDPQGDRTFVASNRGGVQRQLRIRVSDEDLAYASSFDGAHTSTYSGIDADLPRVAEVLPISYDFSDEVDKVLALAPYTTLGFVSGSHLTPADIDTLGAAATRAGMAQLIVTLGSRGSVAFTRTSRLEGAVYTVEAIDALGAGDAFIAGFVSTHYKGGDVAQCLEVGASAGALACTMRGAFGFAMQAGSEARDQLARARTLTGGW